MKCVSPQIVYPKNKRTIVPCGKCLACLSNKRNDWAFRLNQEHRASKSALFVTLTYDWKSMPKDGSLKKRDLQLFLKRVRKNDETKKIRYYGVGEYGTKNNRPHYHLLLFNSDEKIVRKSWTLGIIHIGNVTLASVAYALKYIVQPTGGKPYIAKPFAVMSRAYGIGANYLSDDMVQWHRSGGKNFTNVNGIKGRLPRYYREKIWYREVDRSRVQHESKWLAIKNDRLELKWFYQNYGSDAKKMRKEFTAAVLSRISEKVAFTQTL